MYFEQPFIGMNSDDGDYDIPKGDYRSALNLQSVKKGVSGSPRRENIPGTEQILYSMPNGNSKVIGQINDEGRQQMIFFLWNGQNKDGIYAVKNNQISKIIEGDLGFDPEKPVTSLGITDNYLFYAIEGQEPRYIDLEKTYSSVEFIDQYKQQPVNKPTINRYRDSGFSRDLITLKNLQFAYRYIFNNNQLSNLSPFSLLAPAELHANVDNPTNAVDVTINISELTEDIKYVEFMVREGNRGLWDVFKTEKAETSNITVTYHGNETLETVSDEDTAIQFDLIPTSTKAFSSFKHRNFFANTFHSFDIDGDFDISLSENTSNDPVMSFKSRAIHSVGIAFYDEKMRSSGVLQEKEISISDAWSKVTTTLNGVSKRTIDVNLSGMAPSWAKYWKLLMSEDQFFEIYEQFPVGLYFYVAENKLTDNTGSYVEVNTVGSDEVLIQNHIYKKAKPSTSDEYSYIHLHIPTNIPFIPDTECYVRILINLDGTYAFKEEQIVDVFEGLMVVGDFGIEDWSLIDIDAMVVEVYKPKRNPSKVYYETGNEGIVNNDRTLSVSSVNLEGDMFRLYTLDDNTKFRIPDRPNQDQLTYPPTPSQNSSSTIESPSPCYDGTVSETLVGTVNLKEKRPIRESVFEGPQVNLNSGYTIDYNKIAGNWGRPLLKIRDEREINEENSIFFSDPYVQESRVNGLNRVRVANKYVLPSERTPIVKLQPVRDIMLAIHESNISSLYIGEGYVKQNNELVLIKTDNVIGDDRLLMSGLGSQNPESIVEFKGTVYGFDLQEAEVWRYANGIVPLARTYKMKNWFKEKCQAIRDFVNDPKIYGGFDPFRLEYLLTFPSYTDGDGINHDAETIAFNERVERFVTYYSFIPEMYGYTGEQMYLFKNGRIYKHGGSQTYNNFFGIQYPSKVSFVANPEPFVDKNWNNIGLDSSEKFEVSQAVSGDSETYLENIDFHRKESMFYADFLRDINTPEELLLTGQKALLHGNRMKSQQLQITLENDSSQLVTLDSAFIGYNVSRGHFVRP